MFRRGKVGIPQQLSVPPMPNPNPNYKPPVGVQREVKHMFSLSECKYYAPCGLCTFYNTECTAVRKRKTKSKTPCDDQPDKPKDSLMEYIKSGKGLPPLGTEQIDEHHLPSGIRLEKRGLFNG